MDFIGKTNGNTVMINTMIFRLTNGNEVTINKQKGGKHEKTALHICGYKYQFRKDA